MSAAPTGQAEALLARFPGPVSLPVKTGKKLLSFFICLGFALFFGWLVFTGQLESGRQVRWFDPFMVPISFAFFTAFTLRGVFMLLVPGIGSMTLDARGLALRTTFGTSRLAWLDVIGDFRDEMTYWPLRVGGPLRQVTFEVIAQGRWRRAPAKAARALYDNFALPPDQLAWLLNEWRRRALAQNPPASAARVPAAGSRP